MLVYLRGKAFLRVVVPFYGDVGARVSGGRDARLTREFGMGGEFLY